jgi:hypothetical protein
MRDDEIDDTRQPPDHPATALLERLESDEDLDDGDEEDLLPTDRREVDALVDLIVGEELDRLSERKG